MKQKVRLVGVGISRFENLDTKQKGLFFQSETKKTKLDASVDAITEKFGQHSIRKASLLDQRRLDERLSSFIEN